MCLQVAQMWYWSSSNGPRDTRPESLHKVGRTSVSFVCKYIYIYIIYIFIYIYIFIIGNTQWTGAETGNESVKEKGGLIDLTEYVAALQVWIFTAPELAWVLLSRCIFFFKICFKEHVCLRLLPLRSRNMCLIESFYVPTMVFQDPKTGTFSLVCNVVEK